MTIDWVSIAVAVASALVTALVHKSATQPNAANPMPASPPANPTTGGLFHGGLLHRLGVGVSAGSSTAAAGSATGHPVLDSVVNMLQSVVAQNPQLLTSLSGVLVQLQHPAGTVNLNLSNSGGTSHASQPSSNPAVTVPVGAGS
jgi:hypothetical protein